MKLTILPTRNHDNEPEASKWYTRKFQQAIGKVKPSDITSTIAEIIQGFLKEQDITAFIENPISKSLPDAIRLACQPAAEGISLSDVWLRLLFYKQPGNGCRTGSFIDYLDGPKSIRGFTLAQQINHELCQSEFKSNLYSSGASHLRRLAEYRIVGIDIYIGNLCDETDIMRSYRYAYRYAKAVAKGLTEWVSLVTNKNHYSDTCLQSLGELVSTQKHLVDSSNRIKDDLSVGQDRRIQVLKQSLVQTQQALKILESDSLT